MLNKELISIASFDIGSKNFAFYIEEVDIKELKNIKNISKLKRYNSNGTPTEEFSYILNQIYINGKRILLENTNITTETTQNKYFDIELCYNMIDILNEYSEYWDNVDFIIVEQQMSFGKKNNTKAVKLAQHCESYFINKYGRCNKKIIEFPAYHKTQILGAEKVETKTKTGKISYKNMGDTERKKWAVEQAFGILALRDDFETMAEIGNMKKKDDVSDVIIQLQAFKYLYFIET